MTRAKILVWQITIAVGVMVCNQRLRRIIDCALVADAFCDHAGLAGRHLSQ